VEKDRKIDKNLLKDYTICQAITPTITPFRWKVPTSKKIYI